LKCGRPLFDFEAAHRNDGDYCPDCPPETGENPRSGPGNPDREHVDEDR
jgi:hypothetical protein